MRHYNIIAVSDDMDNLDAIVNAETLNQAVQLWQEYYGADMAKPENIAGIYMLPLISPNPGVLDYPSMSVAKSASIQ